MKSRILHILLFLFISVSVFSQQMRVVSGVINDNDGSPIIGVSVWQKGTTNGTLTDYDGQYTIQVPLGSTLQYSYIGMKTTEMVVTEANSKPLGGVLKERTPSTPAPSVTPAPLRSEETTKEAPTWIEYTPSREDQSLSPYFLIRTGTYEDASMPLKETDVTVNIAGVIADVNVKQIYINESENTLEAIYVFPGSTRAAVYGMTMTIGDRRIDARIKKKEQARQEYEQAKEEGKTTTLLEQHRPNVFQMNVANILPGDTIIVEMKYTELLENLKGQYEFVYPTVVGPRYSETGEEWVGRSIAKFESGTTPQFSIKTVIQAGMPIQKVGSPSHSVSIEALSPDEAVISLSNPKDYEGDRDYILQYELQGGKVQSGLLRYEHGDENFFLLMVQPPKKPTPEQIPPREYIIIVDVSGSMHGFPLEVSKKLISNLASTLRPIDRFNVMLFESNNAMLYKESLPATKENINNAVNLVNKTSGGGGTRLYPALQNAINFKGTEGFSRTFIIATDGFVTIEKEAFNYIRDHLNEANLFPFGIGPSVNRYMIEGLAHAGMGTPYIVTNLTDAERVGQKVIEEISQPVLTNISIDWGDFDIYDVEPVAVPDVFAERPILIYGKYKGSAEGTITVNGLAGNETYEQQFDVSQAKKEYNQALRYLWARNQIRYFDDYAQYYEGNSNGWHDVYGNHQRSAQQIEYVTNLGLKYNLLTQYTSFLAVDDIVRKPQPSATTAEKNTSTRNNTPVRPKRSATQTANSPNVSMSEDDSTLEEVIVVGYGTTRRSHGHASGSTTVSGSAMSSSIIYGLQGKVSGLDISQTAGEPGDASRIRVRGSSSLLGNNSPLVVIDGIPTENANISQMNPSDIDNITVLKDASAAALYGSRGANGVLIITTKKADRKKFSATFSSTFSIETPNQLPKMQRQYAQGRPENGLPVWNKENEPFSWGPDVQTGNQSTYDAYDFFKTGYSFKNFLTLSGKQNNNYYSLRLGNNTQKGFISESEFVENTMGLKFGWEISPKFDYEIDVNYKNTKNTRLQRGYNMSSIMQGILLTPPTFDNRVSTLDDGSQRSAGNAADNPYWTTKNNPFSDETNRFTGRLNLTYKPIRELSIQYQLGGDYLSGEAESALNMGSVYNPTGHIMSRDEDFRSLQSKLFAKFDRRWGKFEFEATLGHEYSTSKRTIDRLDGYHLSQPGEYTIANATDITPYSQLFKRHSNAIFGKAGLNYNDMLFLETAMRGEWSSVSNRTLLSPSVGIAVNLYEVFGAHKFPYMKVYANTSRADKEAPLYLDPVYFNSAMYNLNDASNHFESREVKVDKVKPETIRHYEVGTAIAFWDHRINVSSSLYWKNGRNQLLPTQISTSMVQLENCGRFKAHGFEASLGATLIRNRDLYWYSQLLFSRERNRITDLGGRTLMLAGIEDAVGSYAIEGQPLGVLYGTAYERDTQGRMIIGADGFPVKSDELQVLGDPNPDWRMSWMNSLEYRNFSFSVLFDYKKGGKMWNGTQGAMNYYGTSQYSADHRNTTNYIFPGVLADGTVNNIPVNFYGNNLNENRWVRYGQYGVGEDNIQDASYLKLREISLGYTIRLRMFQQRSFMKISLFATNILLYSNYKGVDPETNLTGSSNGFGLDYFNIPGARSYGVSLKWDF